MAEEPKAPKRPYYMRIERTIVDHLGLKLYDKVSAVVAEIIANSYDADAEHVTVELPWGKALAVRKDGKILQKGYTIKVSDDGHGMTPKEANEFFLKVGRRRRSHEEQGSLSRVKKRQIMGRKGLGKLAPFGVCKIIEVRSAGGKKTDKGYQVTHFQLNYDDIVKETKGQYKDYTPDPLGDDCKWDNKHGTVITLKNFSPKVVQDRETFGRQLGYRFGLGKVDFSIRVNDTKESPEEELTIKEFEIPLMDGTKINLDKRPVIIDGKKLPVKGWIGMAKQPYKNEEFAGVRIYVRGKVAATTRDFGTPSGFKGEFVARSYLVGEMHVEWLDEDEDLIQTHRQDILWSSERGQALTKWGQALLKEVASAGREPRRKKVRDQFLKASNFAEKAKKRFEKFKNPQLEATALELGKRIGGFASEEELKDKDYVDNLAEMIFTVTPHKLLVDTFKKIQDLAVGGKIDVNDLIELLKTSKIAEFASYGQVVVEKLQTIDLLEKTIWTRGATEGEFQKILESAPWLINPQWEPLTANQALKNFRTDFEAWYYKTYKKEILTTTEIENPRKQPDFVLLHIENALQIVEIKPPKHTFGDTDWTRMIKYPTAINKFLDENPEFKKEFPHGVITTLVADKISVNETVKLAMKQLEEKHNLVKKTWLGLLKDTKKAHEGFLKARESFQP